MSHEAARTGVDGHFEAQRQRAARGMSLKTCADIAICNIFGDETSVFYKPLVLKYCTLQYRKKIIAACDNCQKSIANCNIANAYISSH